MEQDKGYFKKGVYYPPQREHVEEKLIIKVELHGYEEIKAKLKELCDSAGELGDKLNRVIPPSQQKLEV